ncbi:hypothetical protein [Alkaliphilus peptidifermentans]|uniref:Uncharacterized protein n=1 Tax=Alkaliphilus peptidifermentans DSM 18978 TaxID=1120976 RepID=A0A1G5EI79_9FIRM|nr:hypothetical protein [Alkaliphilus peptidifermentans]SCY26657.1 hypothetical protein SAMN03080606_01167 [Alkaliphilus peptidifermentans DSM 18978]
MVKHEELSERTIQLLKSTGITWDGHKRVYFTQLHKEFYLKEAEAKTEEHIIQFCNLVRYLQSHLEYGVSIEWGDSELNKYVYKINKENLKNEFELTIETLSRFYDDSDIITFYKNVLRAKNPTIIDLIGTTGAGKTTFCQQFVNKEGKEILEKTITPSGNSTIIQTDIVILEETESRLFLKARTKRDILRDLVLVALSMDTNFSFDLKKSISEKSNKEGLKKVDEKEIKYDSDIFQGVYNLFRTDSLIKEFLEIAEELQTKYSGKNDLQSIIEDNIEDSSLATLLDSLIERELGFNDFYGYRHEISLVDQTILDKTIIPTKTFNKFKEKKEEFAEIISYRILFEQAVLVFKCDERAKLKLPKKFREGIVFRDSQGHNKSEQVGIAIDFEVKNKILLIPAGTGGELVDDKYVDELKNIIISEPEQNVVVITKLDKCSAHEYYEESYNDFIENLKDQVVTTHNNLVAGLSEDNVNEGDNEKYQLDRNAVVKKFIAAFDNAYLSKITKLKSGEFDTELHRIICKGKNDEMIETTDIDDIAVTNSWYDLLKQILERENKVSALEGKIKLKNDGVEPKDELIEDLVHQMEGILDVCFKNFKWQDQLEKVLSLHSWDFRYIYYEFYLWYNRSIIKDISSSGYNAEDKAAKIVKYINSLVLKSDNKINAVEAILEVPLTEFLKKRYDIGSEINVNGIAKKIISNAISRATLISYKLFDRNIIKNTSGANINMIYMDSTKYLNPNHNTNKYGVSKRSYYTDTAVYLGIYCNLFAKFKYNLETYFLNVFKAAIEIEIESLDSIVD